MGQESICGLNIDTSQCTTFTVQAVKAFDFQVWFIDAIAELFEKHTPNLPFSLFDPKEGASKSVALTPGQIQNVAVTPDLNHGFTFAFKVYTTETAIAKAYSDLLSIGSIIINYIETLAKRKVLTFEANYVINNSNEATLSLSFRKRL